LTPTIDRRVALAGLALLPFYPARASTSEQLSIAADDGPVALTRYATGGAGKRPGVVVLHGLHGFERRLHAYERYSSALTAKGIDTYFLRYLTTTDDGFFASEATARQRREAYETRRFDDWAKRVSTVVTAILARPDSANRIGLLGFSLGGYVAADTAARDPRIDALAVLYGGMPAAMVSGIKHLPPLIELHGEADKNVAFTEGEQLVKLAKRIGADAELVPYRGKAHGFDFSDNDPAAADAIGRVTRFFEARLGIA
jgi:carboxymethylenebutenolidase